MFISFLGCDGSGKSAVIAGVTERLKDQGLKVSHGHWRPQALDGGVESASAAADNPHARVPRGKVSSILKLGWLWLNWWLGWWKFLRTASERGVLIFDRYHADLLVDPRRYRYGGPMGLARLASRMMPQPDVVIFLDAEPEVLLRRKQEVGRESLEIARSGYLKLAKGRPEFRILDAAQPLDAVVSEVLTLVGEISDGK